MVWSVAGKAEQKYAYGNFVNDSLGKTVKTGKVSDVFPSLFLSLFKFGSPFCQEQEHLGDQ